MVEPVYRLGDGDEIRGVVVETALVCGCDAVLDSRMLCGGCDLPLACVGRADVVEVRCKPCRSLPASRCTIPSEPVTVDKLRYPLEQLWGILGSVLRIQGSLPRKEILELAHAGNMQMAQATTTTN